MLLWILFLTGAWAQTLERSTSDLNCRPGSVIEAGFGNSSVSISGRNVVFVNLDNQINQVGVFFFDLGPDEIPNTPDDRGVQRTMMPPAAGIDWMPVLFDRYLAWVRRNQTPEEIQAVMFQDLGIGAVPNGLRMSPEIEIQEYRSTRGSYSSVVDIKFQRFKSDLYLTWLTLHSDQDGRRFEVSWCKAQDCSLGTISQRTLPSLSGDLLTQAWIDPWAENPTLVFDQRVDGNGHYTVREHSLNSGSRTLNLGSEQIFARGTFGPFLLIEKSMSTYRSEVQLTTFIPPFEGFPLIRSSPSVTESDSAPNLSGRLGKKGELLMSWVRTRFSFPGPRNELYVQNILPQSPPVRIEVPGNTGQWLGNPRIDGNHVVFQDPAGQIYWTSCALPGN